MFGTSLAKDLVKTFPDNFSCEAVVRDSPLLLRTRVLRPLFRFNRNVDYALSKALLRLLIPCVRVYRVPLKTMPLRNKRTP